MTVSIQQVANNNTFYFWQSQTNLMANALSTSVLTTVANTVGNSTLLGTFSANAVVANTLSVNGYSTIKGLLANGSAGTSGQVLVSNGSGTYWSTIVGSINQINVSSGIKSDVGSSITTSGTISLDVYTDSVVTNTIYPVGTVVSVYTGTVTKALNSQEQIYLKNLNGEEGVGDLNTVLSGVWRNRGLCGTEYRSPSDIRRYYLYQRVA